MHRAWSVHALPSQPFLVPPAGGTPITSYRLEMCCVGGVEGGRGEGGKGKAKLDPPYELAYLGPERTAGGRWVTWGVANVGKGRGGAPKAGTGTRLGSSSYRVPCEQKQPGGRYGRMPAGNAACI